MTQIILRMHQVKMATGLSRSSIYLAMKNNSFPHSISIGSRAVGWRSFEIENWIETRRPKT